MNLPEFNMPVSQDDWAKSRSGFHDKMTRCTRRNTNDHIPSSINILRLSTDFGGPKQEESWGGILEFLDSSGYDVEDTRMTEPREADLLFISAEPDRRGDVEHLLDMIKQGFLGLVLRDEVLVSGLGVPDSGPYNRQNNEPLQVGTDFAVYGACIIHEHISTLLDRRVQLGKHVTMMLELEEDIQNSGMTIPNGNVAAGKIDAFQSLLKNRGHVGGEARWVLAVFDLLRHTRNAFVHIPTLQKSIDGIEEAGGRIDSLAKEYNRELHLTQTSSIQKMKGALKKWNTQLTQITSHWIDKYLQAYPVQSNS